MNYPVPVTNVAFAEPATNALLAESATMTMGIGVFAPFKTRVYRPTMFGGVTHRSYVRVNATWKPGPRTRTEDYWVLIQTATRAAELVKVLVASDLGEEMRGLEWDARVDVANALDGAFPSGWAAIPAYGNLMTEEPF
jgi:hypothetical protein